MDNARPHPDNRFTILDNAQPPTLKNALQCTRFYLKGSMNLVNSPPPQKMSDIIYITLTTLNNFCFKP